MAFCSNCGHQINPDEKFCSSCGQALAKANSNDSTRKIVYDGKIHKCPNCGEIIDAFVHCCPTCNYEIRENNVATSLQNFYGELNACVSKEEKASLIRNFPIPNSKEDIVEFMILASSNINGESNDDIFEAWAAKFEQAYKKAQFTLQGDASFEQVQDIYKKTNIVLKKEKVSHISSTIRKMISAYVEYMNSPLLAVVFMFIVICIVVSIFKGFCAPGNFLIDALIIAIFYRATKKTRNRK